MSFAFRQRIVETHAPVRTADLGGWTDTWFASIGAVCNIAVEPGVTVHVDKLPSQDFPEDYIQLEGSQLCSQEFTVASLRSSPAMCSDIILSAMILAYPPAFPARIVITSKVPGGSGLGTSAAVSVALLAALHALQGEIPDALSLAYEAHAIETGVGLQSGIQDQLASALGGVNLFHICYPYVRERSLLLDEQLIRSLNARLVTFFLGIPRSSSKVHDKVIASLEGRENSSLLEPLRQAALEGYESLRSCDLDKYGQQMQSNNEGQRALHEDLISDTGRKVIAIAQRYGARGWKVNGAGGDGGSLVVLGPTQQDAHDAMLREIAGLSSSISLLALQVARRGVNIKMIPARESQQESNAKNA